MMKKMTIVDGEENEFFARGRRLAALADAGKLIPDDPIIGNDPADLLKELMPARLALMSVVKARSTKVNTHES